MFSHARGILFCILTTFLRVLGIFPAAPEILAYLQEYSPMWWYIILHPGCILLVI
jgi:hypothetical protein